MRQAFENLEYAFWSFESAETRQTIGSYLRLGSQPNVVALKKDLEKLTAVVSRMRQRVIESPQLSWVDDETFDLDKHFILVECPNLSLEEDLEEEVANYFSKPLNLSKPPWEIVVFSNLPFEQTEGEAMAALFFKLHHSFADGIAGLELLRSLTSKKPTETAHWSKSFVNQFKETDILKDDPVEPLSVRSFFSSLTKFVADLLKKESVSPFNGNNSLKRTLHKIDFPLENIHEIKRKFSVSVNDIALSIVSNASSRYQQDSSPGDGKPVDVHAVIPFSLRTKKARVRFGNYLSVVRVRLPSSLPNPVNQLNSIKNSLYKIKAKQSYRANEFFGRLCSILPKRFIKRLAEFQAKRTSFICTNVPWAPKTRYVAGAKILGNYGMPALLRSHGLGFAFITYDGKLCLSMVADPNIVEKPKMLISKLQDSFNELLLEARAV